MAALARRLVVYAVAVVSLAAAPAFGQLTSFGDPTSQGPISGWTVTPGMMVSRTYDDNVLLRAPEDPKVEDSITIINPRADLSFHGQRGEFSLRYNGAFLMYQQSNGLNSFDQQGGIGGRRRMSKRNTVFFSANAQRAPTTELLQFVGVPYMRVGSFTDDISGGLDTIVNKRMSITMGAHFQQVDFDQNAFSTLLYGGYGIGANLGLRERLSTRTTLTVDYDFQRANIGSQEDIFNVQHAIAGLDYQMSENVHVFAAGGASRLDVGSFGAPRTAPSFRLGLSDHYRSTVIDLGFSRSYVPSFGYGGAMQNQEASASIKMPFTRRVYMQAVASYRKDDALVFSAPELKAIWAQVAVGYTARSWIRIEGYYASTHQTVATLTPGVFGDALMSHDQIGVQVVASKPVRIH